MTVAVQCLAAARSRRPADEISLLGKHILLVEDEAFIALDLRLMLERTGARVTVAYSVADGFDAFHREVLGRYDLALLDIRLGDGAVFPLADELSEKSVPILFHSGHGHHLPLEKRYPSARSLCKPATSRQIFSAVDQLIW